MKLIAKDEQASNGKARNGTKAKRSAARPAVPAKPKKADVARKTDVSKKAVKRSGEAGKTFTDTVRDYLREVVVELKKVVWPSRKDTLGSTAVILVIVCLTAVFLGLVDLALSKLLHFMVH
ncbi:MAG: preprotein translocase subunit SecE [Deltaproteobacteria bacterium]|jgi:preprotein translocase subunit SecE|nr:preprotein translocase subunit SecE [Deltaproteobacteria bacterium]MDA8307470.1 preprotein translocase subunit SecE [Deltaproteobacteria bacterium]